MSEIIATSIASKRVTTDRRKAVKAIDHALTADSADAWIIASHSLRARLSPGNLAALTYAALTALDQNVAEDVADLALGGGAGAPIPPLFGVMDEARVWSSWAMPAEREAYCLASFEQMAPDRQAAFLIYAQRRVAA